MDTSKLRQRLREVGRQIERQICVLMEHAPLVRGGVYRLRRKCGKAGCHCTRGELHVSWVFLARERGVQRMRAVPDGEAARWRERTQQYRRYRQACQALRRQGREALRLAKLLEAARAVAPPATAGNRRQHA
jgi:hypothetical protein